MFWLLAANVTTLVITTVVVAIKLWPESGGPGNAEELSLSSLTPLAARQTPPNDIQQSPIFSASRQPVVEETPADLAQTTVADPPHLVGIVGEGGKFRALLSDASTNLWRLVKQGEEFGGWTLIAIESKKVMLKAGDRVETLDPITSRVEPATVTEISNTKAQ
jgi:hypothetical protein